MSNTCNTCDMWGDHTHSIPIAIPDHNPDIPEAMLQKIVLAHVNLIPGVEVWRMNTGGAYHGSQYVQYGEPGQGDVAGAIAPSGRRLEIELKKLRGRQRKTQIEYQARMERLGVLYIVARTLPQAMIPVCEFLGLPYIVTPMVIK